MKIVYENNIGKLCTQKTICVVYLPYQYGQDFLDIQAWGYIFLLVHTIFVYIVVISMVGNRKIRHENMKMDKTSWTYGTMLMLLNNLVNWSECPFMEFVQLTLRPCVE